MSYILDEHSIYVEPDSEVNITVSKPKEPRNKIPPFSLVGRSDMRFKVPKGYDYAGVLLTFNRAEQWFYSIVRNHLDFKTNIAHIPNSMFSKTEMVKKSNAFKSLHSKGLLKRVKRETYMVNPDAVIFPENYTTNKQLWDSLA